MRKNLLLYILLIFLVIVNGFFLYNYLGKTDVKSDRAKINPLNFIIKELEFDDIQTEKVENLNKKHHQKMMRISDEIKVVKDVFHDKMFDESLRKEQIDSIVSLISKKESELDKEVFYHFRDIQKICTDKQKKKLKKIIKDASRPGDKSNRRPPNVKGNKGYPEQPHMDGGDHRPPPHARPH